MPDLMLPEGEEQHFLKGASEAVVYGVPRGTGTEWLLVLTNRMMRLSSTTTFGVREERPTDSEAEDVLARNGLAPFRGWGPPRHFGRNGVDPRWAHLGSLEQVNEYRQGVRATRAKNWRDTRRFLIGVAGAGALLLLLATLRMAPFYYELLRLAVPLCAFFAGSFAYRAGGWGWIVPLAAVAILWNPIVPIWLDRSGWLPLDIAGAAVFGALMVWARNRGQLLRYESAAVQDVISPTDDAELTRPRAS